MIKPLANTICLGQAIVLFDYFNLVTETGLYAELETVDETHPEIERLYNSLMFVNYYGVKLFCEVDEEYLRLEESILKILSVVRTEVTYILVWDPDCGGVNGSGGNFGQFIVNSRVVTGYPWDDAGQYSVNANWGNNTNDWSTSGGGGSSTGNNSGGGNLAFFQQLEHFVQTITMSEVTQFSQQFGFNVSNFDIIDIIEIDCYETLFDEGLVIGVSLDSDCALASIVNWIGESLSLNDEEIGWLMNNENELTKILSIQNDYPVKSLTYFVWVISNELMELDELLESYEDFNPDFFPEEGEGDTEVIENGIVITESHPIDPAIGITPGSQISHTQYRHPHDPPVIIAPDMDFGSDGNIDLLTPNRTIYTPYGLYEIQTIDLGTADLLNKSNDELFGKMEGLMDFFTEVGSEPKDLVLDVFIPRFRNSIGGDLENKKLNELVESTNEMKNFVKEFGKRVNDQLKTQTGNIDINNVPDFEFPELLRPHFCSGFTNYRVNGLKIMINDTEQTNVYTQSFDIDQTTGEWTGVFLVEILDHFGLDDTDLVTFQELELGVGDGFASWWILQHVRNHQPFRTKVQILYTLGGNVNE